VRRKYSKLEWGFAIGMVAILILAVTNTDYIRSVVIAGIRHAHFEKNFEKWVDGGCLGDDELWQTASWVLEDPSSTVSNRAYAWAMLVEYGRRVDSESQIIFSVLGLLLVVKDEDVPLDVQQKIEDRIDIYLDDSEPKNSPRHDDSSPLALMHSGDLCKIQV